MHICIYIYIHIDIHASLLIFTRDEMVNQLITGRALPAGFLLQVNQQKQSLEPNLAVEATKPPKNAGVTSLSGEKWFARRAQGIHNWSII